VLGVLGLVERVSTHRLLDRLVRGRLSIAIVAFALIGIVTLQLGLLKLNSSIGRTLERESVLQRENAALSIQNSELAAGERVESRATQLGMALVPVGAFHFLTARPRVDAGHAAAALRTPVHASGESSESSTTGGGTVSSTGEATPAGTEQSTAGSESPPSGEASSATSSQSAQPSGEAKSAPERPSTPSSPSSAPSSYSPPGQGGEASGGGASEATPAGGTQAGPTG
jgi:cell division protein FtsL